MSADADLIARILKPLEWQHLGILAYGFQSAHPRLRGGVIANLLVDRGANAIAPETVDVVLARVLGVAPWLLGPHPLPANFFTSEGGMCVEPAIKICPCLRDNAVPLHGVLKSCCNKKGMALQFPTARLTRGLPALLTGLGFELLICDAWLNIQCAGSPRSVHVW